MNEITEHYPSSPAEISPAEQLNLLLSAKLLAQDEVRRAQAAVKKAEERAAEAVKVCRAATKAYEELELSIARSQPLTGAERRVLTNGLTRPVAQSFTAKHLYRLGYLDYVRSSGYRSPTRYAATSEGKAKLKEPKVKPRPVRGSGGGDIYPKVK